ncbi:4,5-DOPA dioxygenase extradiol [Sphingomonas sp. S1-29]|uniref:4,5-DOPA-extradiol-dioxygenase n=1 Tax=Sphingomonas sp. S1-29 TaxID=2991074 RepID=UPI00223F6AB7|nr:4,5-DOPA dioxygenase extradiol [Sphingomonas sp. S1-29]UZK68829.1 4,5-DOPA dioxygenase extradiol [Sphingomonas sp. S1-29]
MISQPATAPALFIGHGSPMNTLETNGFTESWSDLGRVLPRPRAILVISAHWFIGATAVTAMPRPRTIHDFYGFPPELFAYDYPAPGAPNLAQEVADVVKPYWVGLDYDQWGLDHGTWSVLAHMYPEADIPVVQLSINALKPLAYHVDLGLKLAALRKSGVMILASGNVVHNLQLVRWNRPDAAFDWNLRFDETVATQLAEDPVSILRVTDHPDYAKSVPTPDHFIPLLYTAGLAAASEGRADAIVRGYAMGSLSMTCYGIGTEKFCPTKAEGAATLPVRVPADQSNI